MQRYIANRLLTMIASLLGVTIIVFLTIRLVPGSVIELMVQERGTGAGGGQ
ncbi:MAG: microcin ABC transporter permease, partial [Chloroflexi bacterium]|nr:microcin ABC transporter permease [Chloroflexota bacterium]